MVQEFESWQAFRDFEREVKRDRRYVRSSKAEEFLNAVSRTCKSRCTTIPAQQGFWRAQLGHDWQHVAEINDRVPSPFSPGRMTPLSDRALEGRVNPKGVPALYLSTTRISAMSEVRPWLGSLISVGHFEVTRDLTVIDCSRYHNKRAMPFLSEPQSEDIDKAVWTYIDRAFSEPVTRGDDTSDYVATQILAELFRANGFDGVAYKSAFGRRAFNLALFDLKAAKLTYCELHEAVEARLRFDERASPYWVSSAKKAKRARTAPK